MPWGRVGQQRQNFLQFWPSGCHLSSCQDLHLPGREPTRQFDGLWGGFHFKAMPARFRCIKAGMQANGNAPSLLIPSGGEWANVPQFIFPSLDNTVALIIQRLLGAAGGCKLQRPTGAAKSFQQPERELRPAIGRAGRDSDRVFRDGLGFRPRMTNQ
jgi:hypothetical protein